MEFLISSHFFLGNINWGRNVCWFNKFCKGNISQSFQKTNKLSILIIFKDILYFYWLKAAGLGVISSFELLLEY